MSGHETKLTLACFTKHAKYMTLSILETSLPKLSNHDMRNHASGISSQNWCLEIHHLCVTARDFSLAPKWGMNLLQDLCAVHTGYN